MTSQQAIAAPVQSSITVQVSAPRAFEVFTAGIDSWWPRSHHIGSSPMTRTCIEQRAGGRCYSEQEDGTECTWGTVLEWEPPRRFVMAWQITPAWKFEPDLGKSSEVEVRFTPVGNNATRVDLERRHLERHGDGAEAMRKAVGAPNGWTGLLSMFAERANQSR